MSVWARDYEWESASLTLWCEPFGVHQFKDTLDIIGNWLVKLLVKKGLHIGRPSRKLQHCQVEDFEKVQALAPRCTTSVTIQT